MACVKVSKTICFSFNAFRNELALDSKVNLVFLLPPDFTFLYRIQVIQCTALYSVFSF